MPYFTLTLESRPPLAILTLGRPGGNRVDHQMVEELREAFATLAADSMTRVAILTGSANAFSLGWDQSVLDALRIPGDLDASRDMFGSTFQFIADSPVPSIAALNGDAFSGGFEIALACDIRVGATTIRLGFPEAADGLLPMGGGTQRLARLAGRGVALDMIMTAEPVDAATALSHGILSSVTEPERLLESALGLGATIAGRGPLAIQLAKEAVHRGVDMPLEQALRFETDLTIMLQTTTDRAEGTRAFEEKRTPHFEGR
jgi:enoyl-CoA hydratase/carnithine racemase